MQENNIKLANSMGVDDVDQNEAAARPEVTRDTLREKAIQSVIALWSGYLKRDSQLGNDVLNGKGADYLASIPNLLLIRPFGEKSTTYRDNPEEWIINTAPNVITSEEIQQLLNGEEMRALGDAAYQNFREGNTVEPLADVDLGQGVHLKFPVYNDAHLVKANPTTNQKVTPS